MTHDAQEVGELVERLDAATMDFDWRDLSDDAALAGAVPLLKEAARTIQSLQARAERAEALLGEVSDQGRILSGGIRRPAKWISIPGEIFARVRSHVDSLKEKIDAR